MSALPVILCYFAQNQDQAHLQTLEREQKAINNAWLKANASDDPIQVVCLTRDNDLSKRDSVIEDIETYNRRIVLFQFSGHAGPDSLAFTDGEGDPTGIAGLLKNELPHLQLVILNGCSTFAQVEAMFQQGIRAVIATHCAVKDSHATEFAIEFHRKLCSGKTIPQAYKDALTNISTKRELRQLLPELVRESPISRSMLDTTPETSQSWGLYVQDNSEKEVGKRTWWDISDTANTGQLPANFYDTPQYRALKNQLDKLNNRFNWQLQDVRNQPNDLLLRELLLETGDQRSEVQTKIDTLTSAVLKLAEAFAHIPLTTERLRVARHYFDAGEYEKARAIFDEETELMQTELADLIDQKDNVAVDTNQPLLDKANEYLIRAKLSSINTGPDPVAQARIYFEQSLKADRNQDNLFAYGKFLQEQAEFGNALPLYEEALRIRQQLTQIDPEIYLPKVAQVQNNLAAIHAGQNEFAQAQLLYEQALTTYQQLAQRSTIEYIPKVALLLNNLAFVYARQNKFAKAQSLYEEALKVYREIDHQQYAGDMARTLNNMADLYARQHMFAQAKALYEEALAIRREHAITSPQTYLPSVAQTLNNLADLYNEQSSEPDRAQLLYEEALKIREELAVANPHIYLPAVAQTLNNMANLPNNTQSGPLFEEALHIYQQLATINKTYLAKVAMTQNNLGDFYADQALFDLAQPLYEESLRTYRQLADDKPEIYKSYVAQIAANLSGFYKKCYANKALSLRYAEEAIQCSLPFTDVLPIPVEDALNVVEAWSEDPDAFLQRVKDSIKTTDQ
ncbi:hypothetical protein BH09BAC4_BH09BAC4_21890 [soil metagenome]